MKLHVPTARAEGLYRNVAQKYNGVTNYLVLGSSILGLGKAGYHTIKRKFVWSIAVSADEWLYDEVHQWLLDSVKETKVRSLLARTGRPSTYGRLRSVGEDEEERQLKFFSDDRRVHKLEIGGHRAEVAFERPDFTSLNNLSESRIQALERIEFTVYSTKARDAVRELLNDLIQRKMGRDNPPKFYTLARWGDWTSRADVPERSLESVVLREGQSEELVADLENFLSQENEYVRRCLPYHRGYLFYGPPGSGKTSIVKALASHFGLDLWYMPINDITKDTNLIDLVAQVKPNSILLLEDIDVLTSAASRDGDKEEEDHDDGVTLSGLLNALDGVGTPHGLIVFMTTNHIEALDEALVRTGRVDRREYIGHADDDQVNRLFQFFYGRAPAERLVAPEGASCSDILEVFKRHMHDPDASEAFFSASVCV